MIDSTPSSLETANIPTFSYREEDFKLLFTGFNSQLSKKEKDLLVAQFIQFISKDIQKQLDKMIKTYKRFKEGV